MESTLQEKENTMKEYKILASRKIYYEFNISANSKEEALEEMKRIELSENAEDYAYNWAPLEEEQE
jgi:hypothetical protein